MHENATFSIGTEAMVMVGRDVPGDHMHASQARECLQERTVQFGAVGDSSLGFH